MPPLPPRLPPLRSRSRKGDLAEILFTARALRLGFRLSKPVGSDCRYDVLVDAAGRYRRAQIKSAWGAPVRHGYTIHLWRAVRAGILLYQPDEVDFFALYIARPDAWYIVPAGDLAGRVSLPVRPENPNSHCWLEKYREAWHLLLPRGVKIGDLKAMAEPASYQGTASAVPISARKESGFSR